MQPKKFELLEIPWRRIIIRDKFFSVIANGMSLQEDDALQKYKFGLPLYRIHAIIKAFDVDFSRQTMRNLYYQCT